MGELNEIVAKVHSLAEEVLKKQSLGTVSAKRAGKNWQVNIEMLERKAVPDSQDLIGEYEVIVTESGNKILSYRRLKTRRRGIPSAQSEE